MFPVKCADCEVETQVPFKPSLIDLFIGFHSNRKLEVKSLK
jgi:hypothetical protein